MSIAANIHTFKTGDTFVGTVVSGDTMVISETRNPEHAQEGHYGNLLCVIPLVEAIAMAKALLASQEQAQLDAYVDEMFQRHLDRHAMEDDHLEHELEIEWLRTGC